MIAQYLHWANIFLFLILFAALLFVCVFLFLPETHEAHQRQAVSFWQVCKLLIQDRNVMAFGLIIAACNGISFSYFAEGPFYLIKILGLSPSLYGFSFIPVGLSAVAGGM